MALNTDLDLDVHTQFVQNSASKEFMKTYEEIVQCPVNKIAAEENVIHGSCVNNHKGIPGFLPLSQSESSRFE